MGLKDDYPGNGGEGRQQERTMGLEMSHPYAKESDMVPAYNLSLMKPKQKVHSEFKTSLGSIMSFR